jgi:branched-chain amino acid transport system ATP-binding protein
VNDATPLLEVRGLARHFGGVVALSSVDLNVDAGSIVGLIGPNGAGKTTLFNVISGVLKPHGGAVVFAGRDITGQNPDRITHAGLVRTFQIARGLPTLTVLENLLLYGEDQPGEALWQAVHPRWRARKFCCASAPSTSWGVWISRRRPTSRRAISRADRKSCSSSAAP